MMDEDEENDVEYALHWLSSVSSDPSVLSSSSSLSTSSSAYSADHKEISEDEHDDDDDEGEFSDNLPSSSSASAPSRRGRGRPKRVESGDPDSENQMGFTRDRQKSDAFFRQQAGSVPRTSSHTFTELGLLSEKDRASILDGLAVKHACGKDQLAQHFQSHFRKWYLQLRSGMNLCFFGLGSKKALLQQFADRWLTDAHRVVINGYHPSLTIKQILSAIQREVINTATYISDFAPRLRSSSTRAASSNAASSSSFLDPACTGLTESVDALTADALAAHADQALLSAVQLIGARLAHPRSSVRRLYLLLHSLDGPALRDRATQQTLAALAALPGVHVLASVDHVNAPLLWDFALLDRFGWVWHDVTSLTPYRLETAFAPAVVGAPTESRARAIQYVLQSLTPNHRNILALLAKHQLLAAETNNPANGLTFEAWFSASQDEMLVVNDTAFRAHLQELVDHDILQLTRQGSDGAQRYTIPYDVETIRTCVLNLPPTSSSSTSSTSSTSSSCAASTSSSSHQALKKRSRGRPNAFESSHVSDVMAAESESRPSMRQVGRPTGKRSQASSEGSDDDEQSSSEDDAHSSSSASSSRRSRTSIKNSGSSEDLSTLSSCSSKRSRLLLTPAERDILEHHFTHVSSAPSELEIGELVARLANSEFTLARCRMWFTNRRSADTRRVYYQQCSKRR